MTHVCKHCNRSLSNERALVVHQKTAKYCLKKRGIIAQGTNLCEYCKKNFTTKSNLVKHQKICKKTVLDEKDRQILRLEQQLEENCSFFY